MHREQAAEDHDNVVKLVYTVNKRYSRSRSEWRKLETNARRRGGFLLIVSAYQRVSTPRRLVASASSSRSPYTLLGNLLAASAFGAARRSHRRDRAGSRVGGVPRAEEDGMGIVGEGHIDDDEGEVCGEQSEICSSAGGDR